MRAEAEALVSRIIIDRSDRDPSDHRLGHTAFALVADDSNRIRMPAFSSIVAKTIQTNDRDKAVKINVKSMVS
jgi:hypothetical protein